MGWVYVLYLGLIFENKVDILRPYFVFFNLSREPGKKWIYLILLSWLEK